MHPVAKTNYSDVIKITIFLSCGIIFSVFSLIQTATATAANRKSHLKSKTALLQTLSRLYDSISFSSSNVGISFWRILKQGRNMVYPGPIDPYFLAVILILSPIFPNILIPEP